jgi:rRNA-processing protein FCF1
MVEFGITDLFLNSLILNFSGTPYITDCVLGELEKLGSKYRIALKIIKDPRFERLPCFHKGTYADDCLVQRVTQVC